jgi:CBS domain-containing protein
LRGFSAEVYRTWRGKSILHVVKKARLMRKFGGVGSSILGLSTIVSTSASNIAESGEFWMRTLDVTEESSIDDEQVTCWMSSPLEEVMRKALDERVHRIWVVEKGTTDVLVGLVTFSDILGAIRLYCK